ncbi:MAG: hypothetical protein JNL79_30680 [Myxococcales bacterium]|nr:hypothetical protein [Myxococcales bacterium]
MRLRWRGRSGPRALLLGALLAPLLAAPTLVFSEGAALAAKKKKPPPKPPDKIIVVLAEGPDADVLTEAVEGSLPPGIVAGNKKEFVEALVKGGQKGPFGKSLDNSKTREKTLERVRKAADTASVDVVVILKADKGPKGRKVLVLVIDPKQATLAREDEINLPAKKPKDASEDTKPIVASVKPTLEKMAPVAPEPEDEPEPVEEKPKEPPKSNRPEGEVDRALVQIHLGLEIGARRFEYADPVSTGASCPTGGCTKLRNYNVGSAPMPMLALDLFPLSGMDGFAAGFGLYAGYGRAVGLKSAPTGGQSIETSWDKFDVGLQYRLALGSKPSGNPLLFIQAGFGGESFTFTSAGTIANEVPNAGYKFLRLGVAARIPFVDRFGIKLGAAVLPTLSGGNSDSVAGRFDANPGGGKTSLFGFDLGAALWVKITGGLEGVVSTRYTRFGYGFEAKGGDPFQASGATETMWGLVRFGLSYAY